MSNDSNNFQAFILQSLQAPLNDPKNATYWLPGLLRKLQNDGKPVLPFTVDSLDVGALGSSGGQYIANTIAASWAVFNSPEVTSAIPCPQDSLPVMKMAGLTVLGLDNITIVNSSTVPNSEGTGFESTILGQFNTYGTTEVANTLSVTGNYDLRQAVCSCDSPTSTTCNGILSDTVVGQGSFTAYIGSNDGTPSPCFVSIVADVTIIGTDASRTAKVQVKSITLQGAGQTGNPLIYFSTVTLTNVQPEVEAQGWASLITIDLNTGSDGSDAIVAMLREQLNTDENLSSLSDMLSGALGNALDSIFGPVGADGLPSDEGQQIANSVDEYYFDRARAALNNPAGPYYVPTIVRSSTGTVLEPYEPAGSISLPDMPLPPPLSNVTLTQVTLEQVKIAGLSNALIPVSQITLSNNILSATATLNALSDPPEGTPPPPLTANASFRAYAGDSIGWLGPSPTTLTVSSSAGITNASMQLTASGGKIDDLVLNFSSLSLTADTSDIAINIQTYSGFDPLINQVINQDSIKSQALSAINFYIADDLQTISQEASAELISLIKSKLGDS